MSGTLHGFVGEGVTHESVIRHNIENFRQQPIDQQYETEEYTWKVFVPILLQRNMRQEVRRFTGQYNEGIILPTVKDVNTEILVAYVLLSKHHNRTSPALEAFNPYVSSPALIDMDITSDIVDQVTKTMKGAAGP